MSTRNRVIDSQCLQQMGCLCGGGSFRKMPSHVRYGRFYLLIHAGKSDPSALEAPTENEHLVSSCDQGRIQFCNSS